ncbi:transcriptional regulator FimZ [Chryseobacterium sp. MOF25P]|jgi:DNA-binding CsgD family transcriptional regulator|uniref:response regulator transcription factor n=1 Tax=unclassified Chryseobacterium TaxID=2593645 RepID=UPI000804843C|nr:MULTISPECIES: helix-turn-helix transcriptional regulator [unclassified Chryseobacterium]OBW39609.1 transcriptional regulator FimZ [Chryseobacterium sp. MOF25P]OBW43768.1 transcriptional regulator FimZ [Chryseobacterium sp. BGARF1]
MKKYSNSLHYDNFFPVSKSEVSTAKNFLEELKALARMTYGCVYIMDFITEKIEILSGNSAFFSGLACDDIEKLGYNYYRRYTTKDGLEILKKVNSSGFKFFECLSNDEKKAYTISYDFQMLDINKNNVLINHKMSPVEICENGDIAKVICVVSYSINRNSGNICVQSNDYQICWRFNHIIDKWYEEPKIILKTREIEIIRLYLQGLKIDEIAERLFISPNTIKFHRSKLFEKIGVNNITEALSYIRANNLL